MKFRLTITLDGEHMRSGDDVALALTKAAADIANRWDGLTLPEDSGLIHDHAGRRAGTWKVAGS